MTIASRRLTGLRAEMPAPPVEAYRPAGDAWCTTAHRQLTEALTLSPRIPLDDSSRIVFFSDCHRGDKGPADEFAQNRELFLQALNHYYRQGFTYVEVGDGDELWKNPRIEDVQRAHRPVFDLLHKFDRCGRLHLLVGNHDVAGNRGDRVIKEGILAREGIVLRHTWTGQEILVVHGHQADFEYDPGFNRTRFVVRHVWKRLQVLGYGRTPIWAAADSEQSSLEQKILKRVQARKRTIEQRAMSWLRETQKVLICGHTHYPRCAAPGEQAYFNTGSCVVSGYITGLELEKGQISLVQWSLGKQGAPIERKLLAPPRSLSHLN